MSKKRITPDWLQCTESALTFSDMAEIFAGILALQQKLRPNCWGGQPGVMMIIEFFHLEYNTRTKQRF